MVFHKFENVENKELLKNIYYKMTVFAKQNANSTVGRQLSAATRSSFMITDILAAKAGGDLVNGRVNVPAGNHNDFDSDEDFGDDADGNSSVCSNGK